MPVVEFCYVEKVPNESLAELTNAPGIESLTNFFFLTRYSYVHNNIIKYISAFFLQKNIKIKVKMFKTLEFSFLPFLIKLKCLNQSQTAIYIQIFDVLYTPPIWINILRILGFFSFCLFACDNTTN